MALFRGGGGHVQEAFSVPGALYYWRSSAGKEVDFLVGHRPHRVPVESKYAIRISGDDRRTIRNTFQRGLIASKDLLDLDNPVRAIPVSVLLALLADSPT